MLPLLGGLAPFLPAQTAARLSIALAGKERVAITIEGTANALYAVEAAPNGLQDGGGWELVHVVRLPLDPPVWRGNESLQDGQRFYRAVTLDLEPVTNMVWIPSGTFLMGSPESEAQRSTNEFQHPVTLSQGFWMGKYEVTQGEYSALIGQNPSFWKNGTNAVGSGGEVTNEVVHPVDTVSWFDATNYCGQLTERERAAGRLPSHWEYRLPTEAEWEYACRAGTTTSHHYGDELRSGMANFRGTFEYVASQGTVQNPDGIYLGRTSEVGSFSPNDWGLHDMHGNVWEWCLDWRGDYPPEPVTDPTGPAEGSSRIIRGGDWGITGWYCRSARRFGGDPASRRSNTGFRLVLAPVRPNL